MESASSAPGALPYYVALSQLLGLSVVAMTGAWLGVYRGGIAWESALQFNVHPLCMVIGLIFLQGDGECQGWGWAWQGVGAADRADLRCQKRQKRKLG